MKIECLTFFIYGMCVMFYSMMVWMFWRKGNDKLSRLIMLLMVVLDLECLKDWHSIFLTLNSISRCGIG